MTARPPKASTARKIRSSSVATGGKGNAFRLQDPLVDMLDHRLSAEVGQGAFREIGTIHNATG